MADKLLIVLMNTDPGNPSELGTPFLQASALKGEGVGETLKKCLVLTLRHLQNEFQWTQ